MYLSLTGKPWRELLDCEVLNSRNLWIPLEQNHTFSTNRRTGICFLHLHGCRDEQMERRNRDIWTGWNNQGLLGTGCCVKARGAKR